MPLIQVKLAVNAYSPEQKTQMIIRLTEAMVRIIGEADPVACVVIEDPARGSWEIDGQPITTESVHALAGKVESPACSQFAEMLQYI
jgi:4-oxalocrotonate tautomerase